jgi:serine/threonine-protein kinase
MNLPLKKMQIKIDKPKKERDVAEIIESDFKLLEQANKLEQKTQITTESQFNTQTPQHTLSSMETAIAQPTSSVGVDLESHPKAETPVRLSLNPEFLEYCRKELVYSVGPMGNIVFKEILAQSPDLTPQQLVEALAAVIPDPQRTQQFKNCIKIPAKL